MVGTHVGPDIASLVSPGEKLRVLDEVLHSEAFARSERLKSLLRFLCEAEIEGREADLTEYTIGTMALGRPAEFSPLEDSSVRSRAHELRQRLEKYYALEAPAAPVRVELRKGSYIPRFHFAPLEEEPVALGPSVEETAAPASPAQSRAASPIRPALIGFAAGAVAMFACVAVWSAVAKPGVRLPATRFETTAVPSPWTPELEAVWAPFIAKRTPLLVAYESRFFVQMGPLVVRDWHVNNIGAIETSDSLMNVQRLFGLHQLYPSANYTDIGAPAAMFHLARLLSSRVPVISVKTSHEMTAEDIRDNNLILVGKPGMDPQIEKVLAAADLVDAKGKIVNVHPRPGEPAEYKDVNDEIDPDGWSEKYSVITFMPNPDGHNRILALTCTGSESGSALAYYLTSPDTVRELYRHLRSGSAPLPDSYQILVRAQFKSKSLVKVDYIAHRVLKAR